jgi:hypothetical protein
MPLMLRGEGSAPGGGRNTGELGQERLLEVGRLCLSAQSKNSIA